MEDRRLHVGQCGLSDQIVVDGNETIYDVLHVSKNQRTYELHTLCGKVFRFSGMDTNVVYVGHNHTLFNEQTKCPVCGIVCEG